MLSAQAQKRRRFKLYRNAASYAVYSSKRSRFITLFHAATKSCKNFSWESWQPYTSAMARSWEFAPKMRSTRLPVHFNSPVARSRPSNTSASSEVAFHVVRMSSRFTKKSLVSASGRLVNTPCWDCPKLAFKTRMPPTRTVISGAVSVKSCARSTNSSSAVTAYFVLR